MKKHLITIEHDLYHIADELARIDCRYRLKYNTQTGKYQLHNKKRADSLLLVYPYDKLDYRAVVHTYKTRWDRAKDILAKLDANEKKINRQALARAREQIAENLEGAAFKEGV